MQIYGLARFLWIFALVGIFLLSAADSQAFDYAFTQTQGGNRLTLTFQQPLDSFNLQRSAERTLTLSLPQEALAPEGQSGEVPSGDALVQSVQRTSDGLSIELKSKEFGFLRYQTNNKRALVIELYPDALGAAWTAPEVPSAEASADPPVNASSTENASSSASSTPPEQALADQNQDSADASLVGAPDNVAAVPPANVSVVAPAPQPELNQTQANASQINASYGEAVLPADQPGNASGVDNASLAAPSSEMGNDLVKGVFQQPILGDQTGSAVNHTEEEASHGGGAVQEQGNASGPVLNLPPVQAPEYGSAEPAPSLLDINSGAAAINQHDGYYRPTGSYRGRINNNGPDQAQGAQVFSYGPATGDNGFLGADMNAGQYVQPEPPDAEREIPPATTPQVIPPGSENQSSHNPAAHDPEKEAASDQPEVVAPADMMRQAQESIEAGAFEKARETLTALSLRPDVSPELAEQALYTKADLGFIRYKTEEDIIANYGSMTYDFNSAINYNMNSPRLPGALLKLSLINLKAGNFPEAKAYFNILDKRYPNDDVIPVLYYSWAEAYMQNKEYQKAADLYQKVLQDYSESKFAREAAMNMTQAMSELGYDQQAYDTAAYMEKRWPRYYIDYIPFLKILGDAAYRVDDLDKARLAYWGYYNLAPNEDDSDMVLAKIGDIYMKTQQYEAAVEVYRLAVDRFPERDGAIISKIRLAESGVYDQPSFLSMTNVFEHPGEGTPAEIYMDILARHPDSPFAKVTLIKLGMYHTWQKDYRLAIETLNQFPQRFPDDPLLPQAQAAAQIAFDAFIQSLVHEGDYNPIAQAWKNYPILHEGEMTNAGKVGLALSLWKEGNPDPALKILHPFFQGPMVVTYSDLALQLAASISLERRDWPALIELADNVALWDISDKSKSELNYALALAYENMGMSDKSGPLWLALAKDPLLSIERRGYPLYFLTMEAKSRQNLEEARRYGEAALSALMVAKPQDTEKIKNLFYVMVVVNESASRYEAALQWSAEYAKMLTPQDPEWAAERYQAAQLFLKLGDRARWGQAMEQIVSALPDSRYGKLAASELNNYKLEKSAKGFRNS